MIDNETLQAMNVRPAECCALCRHSKRNEDTLGDILKDELHCTQMCKQTSEIYVCDEFGR